jgi:hypothetical protein
MEPSLVGAERADRVLRAAGHQRALMPMMGMVVVPVIG